MVTLSGISSFSNDPFGSCKPIVSLIFGLLLDNESNWVFLGAYKTEGDLTAEPFNEKHPFGLYILKGDYKLRGD